MANIASLIICFGKEIHMKNVYLSTNTEGRIMVQATEHHDMCYILVSAGIELILFQVAGMVLCFGYRRSAILVTHRCLSCCWAVQHRSKDPFQFFSLPYCPASERTGGHRELGGDSARPADLTWSSGIPCHMASCSEKIRDEVGQLVVRNCNVLHLFYSKATIVL